jgi:uncharacterized membrane protein (Fun14 family)
MSAAGIGRRGVMSVNRTVLQQLAQDRIADASVLLAHSRWSAAYHLAGYAVECGLKSCVLAHLANTGMIFQDKNYLKSLADCWTHDLDRLLALAGLTIEFGLACQADPLLAGYWGVAKDWKETSRYEQKTQVEAEGLYEAITQEPNGVLAWIRTRW